MGILFAPSAASAGWLPATDLSKEGEFGFRQEPQVAVDAAGGAVAVWPQLQDTYIVQASTKLAGGTWGPAVNISSPDDESLAPSVAMNASGEAVAAWIARGNEITVKAASRTPQGSWTGAAELSVPGADTEDLDVAIDPAGNAVAIWTKLQTGALSGYLIEAATKPRGGQWGSPVTLSKSGNNAWSSKLAVDPSGQVVATWSRWNDAGDTIIQVAEKKPEGGWGKPKDLSATGSQAHFPAVAASAERAVVVWEREDVVEAAYRNAGGNWRAAAQISEPGSREATVGMDSTGNAVAAWSFESEGGLTVEAATLSTGGTWTEPIPLSEQHPVEIAEPQVAVDPGGQAMAVWRIWNKHAGPQIEAASGAVQGGWSEPTVISPPGAQSRNEKIAIDDTGNAVAVWRALTASAPMTIQAAIFDVTNPELSSVSVPSLARAGRPVSFAASPFDSWSPMTPMNWAFGDGSTAVGSSVAHSFQEAGQFPIMVTASDAAGHSTTASAQIDVTPALATPRRVVTVKGDRAHLELLCTGTAVCHGSASLARQVVSKRGKKHSSPIGGTAFAIPAGTRATVTVKLKSKSLLHLLTQRRRGVHAGLTGDAVEPRAVVLKRVARGR